MRRSSEQERLAHLQHLVSMCVDTVATLKETVARLQAELDRFVAGNDVGFSGAMPQHIQAEPIIDHGTMCVCYQGKQCFLGNTLMLRFLERLTERPDHYFTHRELLSSVWSGTLVEPCSIRSVVKDLRARLREAGLPELAEAIDISRWGRFQDADESAYYEYLCKRSGIEVHYCAEQFENDGGPTSTIIKSVKRAMAGEYSELSSKVFKGQSRLIELGYRQGGAPGYGLRRMLIDQAGASKGELRRGEYKSVQTDRVVLVPGPEDEVHLIRRIYRQFVEGGKTEVEIAAELNSEGHVTDFGRPWNRGTIR